MVPYPFAFFICNIRMWERLILSWLTEAFDTRPLRHSFLFPLPAVYPSIFFLYIQRHYFTFNGLTHFAPVGPWNSYYFQLTLDWKVMYLSSFWIKRPSHPHSRDTFSNKRQKNRADSSRFGRLKRKSRWKKA